ncbi:hypothetical protein TYRP_017499 [Tyrophagus putrescentiae]|nr:hypothetical protein TYRP_017499 [Tyrophagus putrescentiae]
MVDKLLRAGQLNRAVDYVNKRILEAASDALPPKDYFKKWFDQECFDARKNKNNVMRTAHSQTERKQVAKDYKALCKRKKREYQKEALLKKILEAEEGNPFRLTKVKRSSAPLQITAEQLEQHFRNLLTKSNASGTDDDQFTRLPTQTSIPEITELELLSAFASSKKRKATRVDNIAGEHLSASFMTLKNCWKKVINHCVQSIETKIMTFRKRGRLAGLDLFNAPNVPTFQLDVKLFEIVKEYVYLGVTMQTVLAFHRQIKRVCAKAAAKIGALPSVVSKLSLNKAMQVFEVQIRPVVTYGLHLFASSLKMTTMKLLDTVKSRFIKRVLQLPLTASTELIHVFTGSRRLCEDLAGKNYPFENSTLDEYLQAVQ